MKTAWLLSTMVASFCFLTLFATMGHAVAVSGQGTWESTLQGRDLDGNAATFEAYYDTVLDITWLVNANINGPMNWANANAWAAGLNINGVTGWRLPIVKPINGSTYDPNWSCNATTDKGFALTTSDGSDGGWRDGTGNPVSEMGHMFYVTLGNRGFYACGYPTDWGLTNTGPFSNIHPYGHWTGMEFNNDVWWTGTQITTPFGGDFYFYDGAKGVAYLWQAKAAWAVHAGDPFATITPPPPASVPNILGKYLGSYSIDVSGCSDSTMNGTYLGDLVINITMQTSNTFSGSAIGTLTTDGDIGVENIQLSGTINSTGYISGTSHHTFFDTAGTGTFIGQLNGNTLTIVNTGHDTVGDTCNYTRKITTTREGVTIPRVPPNIGLGEGKEVLKIEGCGKDNNYAMVYGIKFKPDDKWVLDMPAGRYSGKYEVVIPEEKISLSLNERSSSKLYDYIEGAASSLCRVNVKVRSPKVKKYIINFNDDFAEMVQIIKFKAKDGTTKSKGVFKVVIEAGYTQ